MDWLTSIHECARPDRDHRHPCVRQSRPEICTKTHMMAKRTVVQVYEREVTSYYSRVRVLSSGYTAKFLGTKNYVKNISCQLHDQFLLMVSVVMEDGNKEITQKSELEIKEVEVGKLKRFFHHEQPPFN